MLFEGDLADTQKHQEESQLPFLTPEKRAFWLFDLHRAPFT